jgi:hypothetical protein
MTIAIATEAALAPTQPAVGSFWCVNGVLVVDRSTLENAEPYGECMTHVAGHYERWQEWQALGETQLAAKGYSEHSRKLHRFWSTSARSADKTKGSQWIGPRIGLKGKLHENAPLRISMCKVGPRMEQL